MITVWRTAGYNALSRPSLTPVWDANRIRLNTSIDAAQHKIGRVFIGPGSMVDQVYVTPKDANSSFLIAPGCPLPPGDWQLPIAVGGPNPQRGSATPGDYNKAPRFGRPPSYGLNRASAGVQLPPGTWDYTGVDGLASALAPLPTNQNTGGFGGQLVAPFIELVLVAPDVLYEPPIRRPNMKGAVINVIGPGVLGNYEGQFQVCTMGRKTMSFFIVADTQNLTFSLSGFMIHEPLGSTPAAQGDYLPKQADFEYQDMLTGSIVAGTSTGKGYQLDVSCLDYVGLSVSQSALGTYCFGWEVSDE